jgi:hypothetical protein
MESNTGTNINNSFDRSIIKNIIIYLRTHQLQKALNLISDNVENESIVKAVHDYLLGVNCRYPYIRYDKVIKECGLYNIFVSRLDYEMYEGNTISSKCPCGSLVCINWKYFTRTSPDVWTIAPMEFFTNEYFQQGYMENFKFCSHK